MERGQRGTLPGAPSAPDRIVMHVDADCFYAACERLREPELVGEPVVVGMGYEPDASGGAVATASYEARRHGVESAMPITEAIERLPRAGTEGAEATGHYRPVDMPFYRSVSREVMAVLDDAADVLRAVGIDEAYLDVTDRTDWDEVAQYARGLKDRIAAEVGVSVSVGVGPSMSVAKVASDHDKPDGLVVVTPDEVRAFLAPLPIEDLHGVGPVTAGELRAAGVETAGDLADAGQAWAAARFGQRGRELARRAGGLDDREVSPVGDPKSLSRESAFGEAVSEVGPKRATVERLADEVTERARERGALYRTVGIKIVEPPFEVHTRERSLPGPVDDPALVVEVALDLLDEFDDTPVRKLGVRVANLSFSGGEQTNLDTWA